MIPFKTDSPLLVDAYTILTLSFTFQGFKTIAPIGHCLKMLTVDRLPLTEEIRC